MDKLSGWFFTIPALIREGVRTYVRRRGGNGTARERVVPHFQGCGWIWFMARTACAGVRGKSFNQSIPAADKLEKSDKRGGTTRVFRGETATSIITEGVNQKELVKI